MLNYAGDAGNAGDGITQGAVAWRCRGGDKIAHKPGQRERPPAECPMRGSEYNFPFPVTLDVSV